MASDHALVTDPMSISAIGAAVANAAGGGRRDWANGAERWVPDLRSVRRWLDSNLGSIIEDKIKEKEEQGGPIQLQDILEAIPNKEKLRELMNLDGDVAIGGEEIEGEAIECVKVLRGHREWVSCVCELNDGRLVSGSSDHSLRVWDPDKLYDCVLTLEGQSNDLDINSITQLQTSTNHLITSSWSNSIRVWDIDRGFKCIDSMKGHSDAVLCVEATKGGLLLSGSVDKNVRIWDMRQRCAASVLQGHSLWVNDVVEANNGIIYSVSEDETVRVWDQRMNRCKHHYRGHNDGINCIHVLKDGRIVTGSCDKTIKIWQPEKDYALEHTLNHHSGWVLSVAELGDGRIISGSVDESIVISDPENNFSTSKVLEGHIMDVNQVVELQDGTIVSASDDKTIRLWSTVEEGEEEEQNEV
uniref:Uncharacterized protein n=1 Tax=Palpitomonas bilix TaxID=652834 RepID=A0A7S3GDZ1_9EUKA|mmetsp:Transcript_45352/g.117398  ORF Transcript_45352/g.117398 Transcript_45352/m.117398 type:complete len:414 (+) Transcript_45352:92-1333(+)